MDLNLKANETDILKFSELINKNLKISQDIIQADFEPTQEGDGVTNQYLVNAQNFSLNREREIINNNESINLSPNQIVNKILVRETENSVFDKLPSKQDIINFVGNSFKFFNLMIVNNSKNINNPPITIFVNSNDNNFVGYNSDVLIFPGAIGVFRFVIDNDNINIYYTNSVSQRFNEFGQLETIGQRFLKPVLSGQVQGNYKLITFLGTGIGNQVFTVPPINNLMITYRVLAPTIELERNTMIIPTSEQMKQNLGISQSSVKNGDVFNIYIKFLYLTTGSNDFLQLILQGGVQPLFTSLDLGFNVQGKQLIFEIPNETVTYVHIQYIVTMGSANFFQQIITSRQEFSI